MYRKHIHCLPRTQAGCLSSLATLGGMLELLNRLGAGAQATSRGPSLCPGSAHPIPGPGSALLPAAREGLPHVGAETAISCSLPLRTAHPSFGPPSPSCPVSRQAPSPPRGRPGLMQLVAVPGPALDSDVHSGGPASPLPGLSHPQASACAAALKAASDLGIPPRPPACAPLTLDLSVLICGVRGLDQRGSQTQMSPGFGPLDSSPVRQEQGQLSPFAVKEKSRPGWPCPKPPQRTGSRISTGKSLIWSVVPCRDLWTRSFHPRFRGGLLGGVAGTPARDTWAAAECRVPGPTRISGAGHWPSALEQDPQVMRVSTRNVGLTAPGLSGSVTCPPFPPTPLGLSSHLAALTPLHPGTARAGRGARGQERQPPARL